MSVRSVEIGNAVLGMDMLSDITSLPKGAMRDVRNLDINIYGGVQRRAGARRLSNTTGAHSLWSNRSATLALCVIGSTLNRINLVGDTVYAAPLLGGATGARMRYYEHDERVYFSDGQVLGVVAYDGVRALGVPTPTDVPTVTPAAGDAFAPGRYGAAYSYTLASGEESGLSPLVTLTLADVSGIRFTLPTGAPLGVAGVRLYLTPANGDVLYEVASAAAGLASIEVLPQYGKQASTWGKSRMPAGDALALFHGRLYVAQSNVLWFSEPFTYGLTDLRHNHISLQSPVRFLAPVTAGMFIGTDSGVWLLQGDGPSNFQLRPVSAVPPAVPDVAWLAPSVLPPKEFSQVSGEVAAWLSTQGVAYGLPSGEVLHPQAQRVSLARSEGTLAYTQIDGVGRLIAAVPATEGGAGVALGD